MDTRVVELATQTPLSVSSVVKLQTKQGIGVPHYISLYCTSDTLHYLQAESKSLHWQKDYDSLYGSGLEPHPDISAICLHYLPSMYMIVALLDSSEQIKIVQ